MNSAVLKLLTDFPIALKNAFNGFVYEGEGISPYFEFMLETIVFIASVAVFVAVFKSIYKTLKRR